MNMRVADPKPGEFTAVPAPQAERTNPPPVPQTAPPPVPQAPASVAPVASAAPAQVAPTEVPKKKRRVGRLALMVSVPLVLAAGGAYFWLNGGRYEETDNAYIQQAKVAISSDISGRITAVSVVDNQSVKAGDVIFAIDREPYQIALDQANAALQTARVNVEQLKVSYTTAEANLTAAQSALDIQQATFDRQAALAKQGIASASTLDQPKLTLQQAQTAVVTAQQQVASATAALGGNPNAPTDEHPGVKAAMAQVDLAERNLAKTQVMAPADGVISQVSSLNVGQFVSTGTTIASLVETGGTWVEANYKETQLTELRTGMPAEVKVDAFPGTPLEGTVTSIGAATGSEFSLIPAQNATGNWVKVVQRIPIRVDFDQQTRDLLLRTGMSATVSIDTGHSTLDKLQGR